MEAMPKCTMEKNHKEKRKQTQNEVQREVEKSLKMIQFQIQQEKKKLQTYGECLWLILMLMSVSCHKYD